MSTLALAPDDPGPASICDVRDLRVLVLANARHPIREPFAGGLEAWTWAMVKGLRARGSRVTVFAGSGSDEDMGAHELRIAPLRLSGAARRDASMPAEDYMREHHAYLQAMLAAARDGQFDVIHNASLHYLPVAMADLVEAPMLTTLHTPPTPWLESAFAVLDSPPHVAAVSCFTAASWRHVADPVVVPNGIDLSRWPVGEGGTALVWHGRIAAEKAPHLAVEIARAAGLRIRLAGPLSDPAYFARDLLPLLGDDAEYVGHLGHAALAELLGQSALCLVTPVWDEPYGLVAAEALACGTPVCAFGRGGIPELADESCMRLIPEDDVQGAAETVRELLGARRGDARAHAAASCSLDAMLDQYCTLYHHLRR